MQQVAASQDMNRGCLPLFSLLRGHLEGEVNPSGGQIQDPEELPLS